MPNVEFLFLNRAEVEALVPPMAEVIDIVEAGLAAHGRGEVVLPPKSHIHLDDRYNGHFNVLAVLLHDRQVERNLVEHVVRFDVDDGDDPALADAFPQIDHDTGLLGAERGLGLARPNLEQVLLAHRIRIFDVEVQVKQHRRPPLIDFDWYRRPRMADGRAFGQANCGDRPGAVVF